MSTGTAFDLVIDSTVLLHMAELFFGRGEDYWSWYALLWRAEIRGRS